ncbi:MAG: hypothetical protein HN742_26125 [Lentisphaerae bacterium]|jgi:hypothetical protein|nr:hypothetical protein [Lentisphaerota bacterium]MBT4817215.1 hypothetical protein [Lentisphaerota bacterium]MBT5605558.1 hypothetical protein [Lentisphaerota bacterium]MBT7056835.1 hypothetical protein [Lentisphaerota bacterium]MBT7845379.1 hypothetical protein [Lentisphaerota bacterium]
MRTRLLALAFGGIFGITAAQAEPFRVPYDWRTRAEADRHTSLLATLDSEESSDADFGWGDETGVLYRGAPGVGGKWGKAVQLTKTASVAHFRAGPNVNSRHGSIELWVRSALGTDIWGDGKEHWFLAAEGHSPTDRPMLRLHKRKDGALVLDHCGNRRARPDQELIYTPGKLEASAWHHVLVSWDSQTGEHWLAVDGKGVTGTLAGPIPRTSFFVLWLGSSGSDRQSFAPLGGWIDHVRVSDITVIERGEQATRAHAAVDLGLLAKAELALRRWYRFMERVQTGGWANCYTWPTLLPSPTGSRDFIWPREFVSNDKGHVGPAACWLVYGSEVLREPWYLRMGERMGDAYCAAQMASGSWYHSYFSRPGGFVVADAYASKVKLQDQNQTHPIYLLLYLNRLTGEERYLAAAMKAGEFYLKAQNPNGSWSHSFDLKKGIGVTHGGQPQGGEINDLACNDGMTTMLLMWHFTQGRKYLDAFVRCADWFVAARLGPPTYGWAEQYDKDNNPVWARAHEPPAMCVGSGASRAYSALRQAYWVTGDKAYLEAVKPFFEWMVSASDDGKHYYWYDHKTGRPIVADGRRIFACDDPEQMAQFRKVSVKTTYAEKRSYNAESRLQRVEQALRSPPPPSGVPRDQAAMLREIALLAKTIPAEIAAQNAEGVWVRRGQGELRASGPVVWIRQPTVRRILRYVEIARILIGELPNTFRGDGELIWCAYPRDDWYKTPLRED